MPSMAGRRRVYIALNINNDVHVTSVFKARCGCIAGTGRAWCAHIISLLMHLASFDHVASKTAVTSTWMGRHVEWIGRAMLRLRDGCIPAHTVVDPSALEDGSYAQLREQMADVARERREREEALQRTRGKRLRITEAVWAKVEQTISEEERDFFSLW
jgi:hypothetical protein